MEALRDMVKRPTALFGLVIVALVVMMALAAPLLAPYSPDEQMFDGLTLEGAPLPPSAQFPLGTDTLAATCFRDCCLARALRLSLDWWPMAWLC